LKAFITGIEGFAGHHLAREIAANGGLVAGSYYQESLASDLKEYAIFQADLAKGDGIDLALRESAPDVVYHLAAQSSAAVSFRQPRLTYEVNLIGAVNLLEAVRSLERVPKMVLASSCEVYGPNPDRGPMDEGHPYHPRSPYAASKVAQEVCFMQYAASYGMDVVVARPFPHVGPGQPDIFALPSFARQIAEIEAGRREAVVMTGNLEVERDYTDVGEVVRAYRLLGEKGRGGQAYNICSGKAMSLGQALQVLLSNSKKAIRIERDPSRLRPSDVPLLLGENRKLVAETGWAPERRIEESLLELLDHWRRQVSSQRR